MAIKLSVIQGQPETPCPNNNVRNWYQALAALRHLHLPQTRPMVILK